MAEVMTKTLVDDLDGSPATKSIYFGYEGVEYRIDLNDEHAEMLFEDINRWVPSARRVGGRRRAGSKGKKANSFAKAVREWAKEQGLDCPPRGRIPANIAEAYREAKHGDK